MYHFSQNSSNSVHRNIVQEDYILEDWKVKIITFIYKKGDRKYFLNNRGITLTSIPYKTLKRILERGLTDEIEVTRHRFRTERFNFTIRQTEEKLIGIGKTKHIWFIELQKTFGRIKGGKWRLVVSRKERSRKRKPLGLVE